MSVWKPGKAEQPLYAVHPAQKDALTLLGLTPDWHRRADKAVHELLYGGQRGGGKQISLDTPIPTPTGWTTMGDLAPGATICDRDSRPTRVLAVSAVETDTPCYRLTFQDGTSIVADARHLWPTLIRADVPWLRTQYRLRSSETLAALKTTGEDFIFIPCPNRLIIVESAEPVPSVPMRCIQVSNPTGLYLAGEGMVPTHNSYLLRAAALTIATIWPGSVTAVFRRTYAELEETHIRAIQREIPPSVGTYFAGRRELHLAPDRKTGLSSIVEFRHCEHEDDVTSYLSAEWDALLIDEATQFTPFQIAALRASVRSTRPNWRPIYLYTANPGGPSHQYFKGAFVDAAPDRRGTPWTAPPDQGGYRRAFLPAALSDNPSLPEEYRRALDAIPDPDLRRAWRDGDWSVFLGQYFAQFKRGHHTCQSFEIPPHWHVRRIAVDFGFGAPWAALYAARDEDAWRHDRIARWYVYREHYGPGVRDEEQARLIKAGLQEDADRWERQVAELRETGRDEHGRPPARPHRPAVQIVADPSMWNSTPSGTSIAEVYRREGVILERANNDRVAGWQRVHAYLADAEDGLPGLIVFKGSCPNLIAEFPAAVHDKSRPEDIDTTGSDHALDAARYLIMSADPLEHRAETARRSVTTSPAEHTEARQRSMAEERADLVKRRLPAKGGRRGYTSKAGH